MSAKRIAAAGGVALASLALAAGEAVPAAAKPNRVQLRGKTAQGKQIRLVHHGGSVQIKRFTIHLRCNGGAVLIDEESGFQPTPIRGGRVRDLQVGSSDRVWIRGKMRGRSLRGVVRVRDKLEGASCDSRWVRFAARLR